MVEMRRNCRWREAGAVISPHGTSASHAAPSRAPLLPPRPPLLSPLSGRLQPQHGFSLTKKEAFILQNWALLGCQYSHIVECKNHKSGYFRAFPRLPRCTAASLKAPLTIATCFFHCQNLFLTSTTRVPGFLWLNHVWPVSTLALAKDNPFISSSDHSRFFVE